VDTGFREGDTITPHYDPLLAKVLAHGDTRAEAIERLLDGLAQTQIQLRAKAGPKRTNLEWIAAIVNSDAFRSGQYTTHLVQELTHPPSSLV
jgi:3-methylcrotonyl-CoA carboxylase alpha subunit